MTTGSYLCIVCGCCLSSMTFLGCGAEDSDSQNPPYQSPYQSDSGPSGGLPTCHCCGCGSGGSIDLSHGSCPAGYVCAAVGSGVKCLPGTSPLNMDATYQCKGTCYPEPCPQCQPDCSGKECGEDGCGGTCGSCNGSEVCDGGKCKDVQSCTATCGSKGCECGFVCGQACGSCSGAYSCNDGCHCECLSQCAGKECGDDGCGGSCGG